MKKAVLLSVSAVFVFAAPLFAAPPNMQPGNWEITMKMQVEGVPFSMPPMKMNHCYTKQDVEDSRKTLPSGSGRKNDCETRDMKVVGNSATWSVVCKDGSRGSGEISYKGAAYDATLRMTTRSGGKSTTNIKARRTGDCK